ncbi:MAG TPA: siderophore-interacting protein [Streptosporangiales bacterium]
MIATRPVAPALDAEVAAVAQVTPNVRRITLRGLDEMAVRGADQWFRLFLPRHRGQPLRLPRSTTGWWPETLAMPETERPLVRNYTVRAARPHRAEIDVDFVLHGDEGAASAWAASAEPGDRVGVLDQGVMFAPPPRTRWQLLVGDETALPAIAGVLRTLPAGVPTRVYVELPSPRDAQPLRISRDVHVTWLPRPAGAMPGSLATEAVSTATLPDADAAYAWLAGESSMVRMLRRHLVNTRGVAKSAITFTGYWRHGVSYSI